MLRTDVIYKALHFTPEFPPMVVGGIGTFMGILHQAASKNIGFVVLSNSDMESDAYLYRQIEEMNDVTVCRLGEYDELVARFSTAFIHFYGLQSVVDWAVEQCSRVVYVMHSFPIEEPFAVEEPFRGDLKAKHRFERMCSHAEAIVAVSHAEYRRLARSYPGYAEKCIVVHNGYEFSGVAGKLPTKRGVLGYLGRLTEKKGLLEVLRVLRYRSEKLLVASGCDDQRYLTRVLDYIEASGMAQRVEFLGWCSGERTAQFFVEIDALVIPSLYEPFGYVALEAIDREIPLVASCRGGIAEILENYPFLFDPYKPTSLVAVLDRLTETDNAALRELCLYTKDRAMQCFGVERMVLSYDHIAQGF